MIRTVHKLLGCLSLLFIIVLLVCVYNWPRYVDSTGRQAAAKLSGKRESVSVRDRVWFRKFQILGSLKIPEDGQTHGFACAVDEQTYDSLHTGTIVSVHYLPSIIRIPILPAVHADPCTSWAQFNGNLRLTRVLLTAVAALLFILLLRSVFRIRIAVWLLLPWAGLLFYSVEMPQAETAPDQSKPATATVLKINRVHRILQNDESEGLELRRPYQIVQLQFLPPGLDTPVIAVDAIDEGSNPDVKEGAMVAIEYDAQHPRIARLQNGSREFPSSARLTVLVATVMFLAFLFVAGMVVVLLKRFRSKGEHIHRRSRFSRR